MQMVSMAVRLWEWWGVVFLALALLHACHKDYVVTANERTELQRGTAATRLAGYLEEDPLGDMDTFEKLTPPEQKKWSKQDDVGFPAKQRRLREMSTSVSIAVKLVGFDGHGGADLVVKPEEFMTFLKALKLPDTVSVIHGQSHALLLRHKVSFTVVPAPSSLGLKISKDIFRYISKRMSDAQPVMVPHDLVDKHIGEAEEAGAGAEGHTKSYSIYIINPKAHPVHYAFSYSSSSNSSCGGASFQNKRYLWFDLSAGPLEFGPLEGHGTVSNRTFLSAAAFESDLRHGPFLAHAAALVGSAVSHLFAPGMLHHPVPFSRTTHIWLIHMPTTLRSPPPRRKQQPEQPKEARTFDAGGAGLDFKLIQDEIMSHGPSILLPTQHLLFHSVALDLAHCSLCSLALHRSLRTGTRVVEGRGSEVYQYLDSLELQHLLSSYWHDIRVAAKIPDVIEAEAEAEEEQLSGEEGGGGAAAVLRSRGTVRYVPLFVFDMASSDPILLDAKHQAVAFDNMVIAVRTEAKPMPSAFHCQGEAVVLYPGNITRPLLAALLQTTWGVAPSHAASFPHSSPGHPSQPVPSWLWSPGLTPFGPFSSSVHSSVTLLLRDTALRNTLLSLFNHTLTDALLLLQALQEYGNEMCALKSPKHQEPFAQRWGVLQYKLDKAAAALSALDFVSAVFFLRSSRHDLTALYAISTDAAAQTTSSLLCYTEVPVSWLFLVMLALLPILGVAVWQRLRKALQRKEKRF